jgi:hypothetical protein
MSEGRVVRGEMNIAAALAEHAEFIRSFMRTTLRDAIEAGRRLTEAQDLCGYGNWLAWLSREFEWDERTARRLIGVYKLSLTSDTLSDLSLKIPLSAAYMLAAPSTPVEARQAVIAAAEAGEKFTVAKVKETIAEARDDQIGHSVQSANPPPSPSRRSPPRDEPSPNLDTQLVPLARDYAKETIRLMEEMTPPACRVFGHEMIASLNAVIGRSGEKQ